MTEVHSSFHLAANQVYLRKLRHSAKEERRGHDLYGRLQRDRGGHCALHTLQTYRTSPESTSSIAVGNDLTCQGQITQYAVMMGK
ncbi:hypothetical protein Q5P01_009145 [Channa striata]|uniref:Uncharacterized protein n=1 Tax=Channa striata TaxID=64152 RepID=A0AA88N4W2_CHASR|nr:hypothetical protein Q5P01_009145 [Channa striata]